MPQISSANLQLRSLNGHRAALAVERAIGELRRGRAIYFHGAGVEQGWLAVAAETMTPEMLERLSQLALQQHSELWLAITTQRAQTLRIDSDAAATGVLLPLRGADLQRIAELAGSDNMTPPTHLPAAVPCDGTSTAILELARQSRLLPAVVLLRSAQPATEDHILQVRPAQLREVAPGEALDAQCVQIVSEARVPLAGHENCRLVLFRDARDASEHVAVLVGDAAAQRDAGEAVSVRMHSACLTGDLLGSLRCDCGDQLRGAVDQLAAVGGGVLLYLAQEGRGIGLANKLRAYRLQDAGLDTIDADQHLGFRDDERSYGVAAAMLQQLQFNRIRLLTNNPAKLAALTQAGLEIVSGERVIGAVNRHNVRYLRAKRERAGHLVPDVSL